jgi:hypothetical protein
MQRAYLDPSVINRAVDTNVSASCLRDVLGRLGFEPATGLHTVLELARSFLSSDSSHTPRAQQLFGILRDLEPAYQPDVPAILAAEVQKLRLGTAVLPFLNALDLAATRNEVARLANGFFDDRARRFIHSKQIDKKQNLDAQARHVSRVHALRSVDPVVRRLRTFHDVWSYFEKRGDIPRLIADVLHHSISSTEALELAARLPSFPAISAATRANVYLNFIMLASLARPGKDKLDDYTHCIEASYCPALVSADSQQITALRHISPRVRPIDLGDLPMVSEGAV